MIFQADPTVKLLKKLDVKKLEKLTEKYRLRIIKDRQFINCTWVQTFHFSVVDASIPYFPRNFIVNLPKNSVLRSKTFAIAFPDIDLTFRDLMRLTMWLDRNLEENVQGVVYIHSQLNSFYGFDANLFTEKDKKDPAYENFMANREAMAKQATKSTIY